MRKIILIYLSLIITTCYAYSPVHPNQKTFVSTKINKVTLYRSKAEITRTGIVEINEGRQTLIFTSLNPNLIEGSLQVKFEEDLSIISLNTIDKESHEISPEIKALNTKIKNQLKKIDDEKVQLSVLQDEEEMILSNKSLIKEANTQVVESVQKMAELYRTRLSEIRYLSNSINYKLNELNEELALLKTQLHEKNSKNSLENFKSLVVEIDSKKKGLSNFSLNYLVNNASWSTSYDIKVNNINQPIQLITKAEIKQTTGEDWSDVLITLSTGEPNKTCKVPNLRICWLNPIPPTNNNGISIRGNRPDGQVYFLDGVRIEPRFPSIEDIEESYIKIKEEMTLTRWELSDKINLPSDGTSQMFPIQNSSLNAIFRYESVPSLDNKSYLVSHISEWEQKYLTYGKAKIYYQNHYLAETILNPYTIEDTLKISIGPDPSIVVKREIIKDLSKIGFLSSNKIRTIGWKHEIKNNKSTEIEIDVYDQVPVTSTKEIEIEIQKYSEAIVDLSTGILHWKIKLKPGEKIEKTLIYTVKYPKNMKLSL